MPTIYTTGERIDHYQILRQLGRGAASHVYLAQDWHALQEVVLKFPDDDVIGGAAVFERYKREAEIGRRLSHPYIRRHLYQDEQRSAEYLVLEYMRGRTLREVLQKRAPDMLPNEEVLRMLIQVCSALAYALEHGVIQRDIKPEHIMLLENGDSKIFDFGIALLEGERASRRHGFASPIGTPDYMAPERLLGAPGDKRADIYAVGVVLYELLFGRTPFEEQDGFALVTQHISQDPPGVLQFDALVSPALTTVVMRAIRRDPDKRYACMPDLLYDLQHLDSVAEVTYRADPPRIDGRYLQVMPPHVLIVLIACGGIVAFGLFTQIAHHLVR